MAVAITTAVTVTVVAAVVVTAARGDHALQVIEALVEGLGVSSDPAFILAPPRLSP
ncbi:hypothetical protein [Streptomyces hygroscopicus]|uniref:hypothetical protein n=1 Tax=Streptomyces hygroscopicus TaxID=1912 RepID=UPI0036CED559